MELAALLEHREFVISRIWRNKTNKVDIVTGSTILEEDDKIFVITTEHDAETIKTFIGQEIEMDRKQWIPAESAFCQPPHFGDKPELTGTKLGDLQLRRLHGINVTRVNRAGVELVATQGLQLQVGDRVTVVGSELAVDKVSMILGNSMKRLNEPNLIPIFIGIALGIILGSIPISFPGFLNLSSWVWQVVRWLSLS